MFRVVVSGFAFSASTLVAEAGVVSQQPSETVAELDENLDLSVAIAEDEDFEDEMELSEVDDTASNEGSRRSWALRRRRRRVGQAWGWTRRRATPAPTPSRTTLWHRGNSFCTTKKPCTACSGDCDKDADCSGTYRCFQRDGLQGVPGCTGTGTIGIDYCYNPANTHTALKNRGPSGCSAHSRCAACQGDCDGDGDCMAGHYCFQRSLFQKVPGCAKGGWDDIIGQDYCAKSTPKPTPRPTPKATTTTQPAAVTTTGKGKGGKKGKGKGR